MTEAQINQLIELGRIMPDMAKTAQELARLAELAQDASARNILTQIMRGYLSCADDPVEPFLEPVPMGGGADVTTYRGSGDVKNVDTVDRLGYPMAVWRCRSFMHRLQFLYDGLLCVAYGSPVVPTLSLRLDWKELGFEWNADESTQTDY